MEGPAGSPPQPSRGGGAERVRQPEGATSQPWRECRAERVGQPGESAAQPSRGGGAERVGQPAEVRQPAGVGQPSEAAAPSPRGRLGGHQVGPSGWSNQQDWPLSPRGESGPSGWGDHQELPPNPRGEAGPIGWGNLQERPPSPHWETWPSEGANQSGLPRRTRGQTGPSLGGEPPPWLAGPVTAPSTANGRLRSGSGVGAAPRDGPETRVAGPKNVDSPPRPSSSSLPATGALSTIVAQPAAADPQPGVGSPALPAAAAAREHFGPAFRRAPTSPPCIALSPPQKVGGPRPRRRCTLLRQCWRRLWQRGVQRQRRRPHRASAQRPRRGCKPRGARWTRHDERRRWQAPSHGRPR